MNGVIPPVEGDRNGVLEASISVAVVIPAYQAASTLDSALASVLGQTYQPTEVMVVDDGSTDGTAAVAERWSGLLPLTVARGPQGGAALARHQGINTVTAEVIALLDADDVWMPDHLETLIRTRAGLSNTIVAALGMRWVPGNAILRVRPAPLPQPSRQLERILHENFGCGSAIFERDLYQRAGGFRAGFTIGEDWDLWIRMIRAGGTIVRPSHPTFLYRMSPTSLTQGARVFTGAEAVLVAAKREAASEAEARWARDGLRRQSIAQRRSRANSSLIEAYDAARHGDTRAARRHAIQSLSGPIPVAARGLAMAAAPGLGVRLRDRRYARRSSM